MEATQIYNVQLTRPQLELIEKLLADELATLDAGYAHPHPTILKRAFDAVYVHLMPTPQQKQQRFDAWVKQVTGRTITARSRGVVMPSTPGEHHD